MPRARSAIVALAAGHTPNRVRHASRRPSVCFVSPSPERCARARLLRASRGFAGLRGRLRPGRPCVSQFASSAFTPRPVSPAPAQLPAGGRGHCPTLHTAATPGPRAPGHPPGCGPRVAASGALTRPWQKSPDASPRPLRRNPRVGGQDSSEASRPLSSFCFEESGV